MNILLIYPPITNSGVENNETNPLPPLGIAYLAAYAEREGHTVRLMDAVAEGIHQKEVMGNSCRVGLSDEQIRQEMRACKPRVVGVSSMFSSYAEDAYRMARLAKEVDPSIITVFGGAHVCALPDKVLENQAVDLLVIGEGEVTFAELLRKIENNEDYMNIQGLAYRTAEGIHFTQERPLIQDLDTLPFPARHLLPMDVYLTQHYNPYVYHNRHTFMMTSRGCPKRCIYCSIQSIWGFKWRKHSADYVVREIEHIVQTYGVREIHFVDDNLTANSKNAKAIFQAIIAKKLNIKWACPNGTAIWTLDEELVDLMKQSGCYRLTFGIEAASKETQDYIKKKLDVEQARKMIAYANKVGIWTVSTFILGFPNQTKEQIAESVQFAIESDTDFATFYTLMPFPKTELWELLKKDGLVDEKDFFENISYYLNNRGLDTNYFTHQQIQQFAHEGHNKILKAQVRRLLFKPIHFIRKIRSVGDLFYFAKLLGNFWRMASKMVFSSKKHIGGGAYWGKKPVPKNVS